MHVYEIYEHERYGLKAVKEGFSWWAFLAPSVWAAALGLGRLTLLLVLASTLLFDILDLAAGILRDPLVMAPTFLAAYLAFGLKPGLRGYLWVGSRLRAEGWRRRCRVVAPSSIRALAAVRSGKASVDPGLLTATC